MERNNERERKWVMYNARNRERERGGERKKGEGRMKEKTERQRVPTLTYVTNEEDAGGSSGSRRGWRTGVKKDSELFSVSHECLITRREDAHTGGKREEREGVV